MAEPQHEQVLFETSEFDIPQIGFIIKYDLEKIGRRNEYPEFIVDCGNALIQYGFFWLFVHSYGKPFGTYRILHNYEVLHVLTSIYTQLVKDPLTRVVRVPKAPAPPKPEFLPAAIVRFNVINDNNNNKK